MKSGTGVATATMVAVFIAATAQAATMSEYFDYGDTQTTTLTGLNGGDGWGGAWSQTTGYGTADSYTDYRPTVNLTSSVTGYVGTGNTGGAAGQGSGGGDRNNFRDTGGLTGTIWFSALFQINASFNASYITFDRNHSTWGENYLRFQVGNAANAPQRLLYANTIYDIPSTTFNFSTNQAYVLIGRVTIDDNGSNDRIELWTHPSDVSTIAALGAPDFNLATADVFGTSMDYFGIDIRNSYVDAIRISDEPYAFEFVTTGIIPEPASLGLIGVAAMFLLGGRRRVV